MKGKTISSILFVSITILGLIFYCLETNKRIKNEIWNLHSAIVEKETAISDIQEILSYQIKSEHKYLNDSIQASIPKSTYIIRLHESVCLSCYAGSLIHLKKELKNDTQLFIFGSYHFETILKDVMESIGFKFIKYCNHPNQDILPVDSLSRPYVFSIDETGHTRNVFILPKDDLQLIKEYIDLMKRNEEFVNTVREGQEP